MTRPTARARLRADVEDVVICVLLLWLVLR